MNLDDLRKQIDELEEVQEKQINGHKLIDKLQEVRDQHAKKNTDYEEGFTDGVQQAMNEVVGLLDKKRL